MTDKRKGRMDGRGRSEGSRRTQFAPGNQAARGRGERKSEPVRDNAVEPLRAALFEDVSAKKNGRNYKIPYIDAFFQKIMADALTAPLRDKIKFYNEIVNLGIMDVQEYKKRVQKHAQNYCDKAYNELKTARDFINNFHGVLKLLIADYLLFKISYGFCVENCTCGVAKRAVDQAGDLIAAEMRKMMEAAQRGEPLAADGDMHEPAPREGRVTAG